MGGWGVGPAVRTKALGLGLQGVLLFLLEQCLSHLPERCGLEEGEVSDVTLSSQVVQSGGKNIELAVMRRDQPLKVIAKCICCLSLWSIPSDAGDRDPGPAA